jgi:hypothetical protein
LRRFAANRPDGGNETPLNALNTLFSGVLPGEQSVISSRYTSSRPHDTALPRQHLDAHARYRVFGPIQPMEQPGFLQRLFGRR